MDKETYKALKLVKDLAIYEVEGREVGKKVFLRAIKRVEEWIEEVAKDYNI